MEVREVIPLDKIQRVVKSPIGWIINNLTFVPDTDSDGFIGYELEGCEIENYATVQEWLKTNTAELPPTPKALRAKGYLNDTDWYVTREIETGKPMPEEVRAARERAKLVAHDVRPVFIED